MSSALPDVSWAGPLLRAQQKLADASELIERRRISEALDLLSSVMQEVSLATELVVKEHGPKENQGTPW
jgi:hypothetical protein